MAQQQCNKCGETVDDAKAFCPGCGQPFVEEEKRKTTSEFESVDLTQKMGRTAYNQMLTDMGLNISRPNALETPPEVPAPIPTGTQAEKRNERVVPIAPSVESTQRSPRYLKWIIAGVVGLVLAFLVLFAAGFLVYWFSGRS